MQQTNWKDEENTPVTPKLLGTKVFLDFPIEDVIDYIDWNPFFQVCMLRCAVMAAVPTPHRTDFLPNLSILSVGLSVQEHSRIYGS